MTVKAKEIMSTTMLRVGRAILTNEHNYFLASDVDDTEHIPKLKTIIASIGKESQELGASRAEAHRLSSDLKEFAKQLFMNSWMIRDYNCLIRFIIFTNFLF